MAGQALADFTDGAARLTDLSLDAPGEVLPADSVIAPLAARPRGPAEGWLDGRNAPRVILSVGDCQSARTALEAVYEGHEAARSI